MALGRAWCWLLLAASLAAAAPPEIANIRAGATGLIFGVGFVPGQTEVWAAEVPFDLDAALKALRVIPYEPKPLLPSTPPANAQRVPVLEADPKGLVVAVAFGPVGPEYDPRAAGALVCWVRNPDGWSKPYQARPPQPWWVFPAIAAPGETVRLFGRDLAPKAIVLKPRNGRELVPLEQARASARPAHEWELGVPADLAPGSYDVWVHNGTAGAAGWAGGLPLTVRPRPKVSGAYLDARAFGVKGNGMVDDTAALRAALAAAGRNGETVLLPPGRFLVRGTIEVPPGVDLVGTGVGITQLDVPEAEGATKIDLSNTQEGRKECPAFALARHSRLAHLTLLGGARLELGIAVLGGGVAEDVTVEHCRVRLAAQHGMAVAVAADTSRLAVVDCELEAEWGLDCVAGVHRQATIARNTVRCSPSGWGDGLSLRGLVESVVEANVVDAPNSGLPPRLGFRRNPLSLPTGRKSPLGWFYHVALIANTVRDQYLVFGTYPRPSDDFTRPFWTGAPTRVDETTLTVDGEPFWIGLKEAWAVVTAGRGLGQWRRVVGNGPNVVAVAPAWDVLPDATSTIVVDGFVAENLFLSNGFPSGTEDRGRYAAVRTHTLGNVFDRVWRAGVDTALLAATGPAIGNDFVQCVGRNSGFRIAGGPLLGNALRACTTSDSGRWSRCGLSVADRRDVHTPAPGPTWNVVEGCRFECDVPAIQVAAGARHLILRGNTATGSLLADASGLVVPR